MTRIVINQFLGERPRIPPSRLPALAAQTADNTNIVRGSLKAFRGANAVYSNVLDTGTVGTIYLYRKSDGVERWLEWAEDVDVQPGPIAGDTARRTYFTGTDRPRVFDDTMVDVGPGQTFPQSTYRMGVERPAAALTATPGAGGSGSARDVTYVYTNVRKWPSGTVDEGQPSPASNVVSVLQGQEVTLTGFSTPNAEYGITHRWIYRINTGETGAEYQFLAEITAAATQYVDTTPDTGLGEVMQSEEWAEPPDDLRGLIALPNGCFAGFSGKEVCFSYPYQVHAWPVAYRVAVTHNVVGLGAISNTVVAVTDGPAFLIDGQDPTALTRDRVPAIYPCLSKRGIVSFDDRVLYPSHEGIAFIGLGGTAGLFTQAMVSREEWGRFYPASMHAAAYSHNYVGIFSDAGVMPASDGFLLNYKEPDLGIVGLFGGVHCLHFDAVGGKLYYVATDDLTGTNKIYEWDAQVTRIPYIWRSKRFVSPEEVHFAAARVLAKFNESLSAEEIAEYNAERDAVIAANQAALDPNNDIGAINGSALNVEEINGDQLQEVPPPLNAIAGLVFRLYADDSLVANITVTDSKPFRLPNGFRGTEFEIELNGQIEVHHVVVATSVEEIAGA